MTPRKIFCLNKLNILGGLGNKEVRFLTRLNNIYSGSLVSHRSTVKPYCLINGNVFEVPYGYLGWYPKILYRFADQLEAMLTHSRCVMAVRFDLRMNGYSDSNVLMTIFWRRLRKKLKRRYANFKLGFVWVREKEKAKQQHYHVVALVSKDIVHYSGTITTAVIEVWKGITDTQAHIPKNCYYTVKENNWQSFEKPLKRVAYLAKSRGKGYKPDQTKDFGSSRIKSLVS